MSTIVAANSLSRNLIIDWIYSAINLPIGEEIYLNTVSKHEQKILFKELVKEKKVLAHLDAEKANSLHIYPTFKDLKHWVVIKKTATNAGVGFVKSEETGVRRVSSGVLSSTTERQRRLQLMAWDDRLTLAEIEEMEGTLTEEERKWLF